ncbi:MAG: hypothetical protein KGI25_02960 [Thaumarchaeota archaeon]|nr:hypothetical protein [Nitrososphaerota archaeon]
MANYQGPERRAVITFTREDADRLVRLEEKVDSFFLKLKEHMDAEEVLLDGHRDRITDTEHRVSKIEKFQSWIMGIGSAVTFIITSSIFWITGNKH